ncbi:hypothetical protein Dip510_002114 [Elusimicrobium posterum]|uniref:hypothetical protein n=1 Tax=Elusimicrobium posterum TaxID=3116653 RepID=UPI003C71C983
MNKKAGLAIIIVAMAAFCGAMIYAVLNAPPAPATVKFTPPAIAETKVYDEDEENFYPDETDIVPVPDMPADEKSKAMQASLTLKAVTDSIKRYYLANAKYPKSLDYLDIEIPGKKEAGGYIVSHGGFEYSIANDSDYFVAFALRKENGTDLYSLSRDSFKPETVCIGMSETEYCENLGF